MAPRRSESPSSVALASRRYRERHPERAREAQRWREKNRDQVQYLTRQAERRRRKENPDYAALSRLWTNYRLRPEQYQAMVDAQDGLCAVCGQPETTVHYRTGKVQRLAVDHDHYCCPGKKSCGRCIRGLLCERCNTRRLEDDPELFRAYADYLERYIREAGA